MLRQIVIAILGLLLAGEALAATATPTATPAGLSTAAAPASTPTAQPTPGASCVLTINDLTNPAIRGTGDATLSPRLTVPLNDVINLTLTGGGSYLINGLPASKTPPWKVDVSNRQWTFTTTGCAPALMITVVGQ